MSDAFDRESWDRRWTQVVREHGDRIARMPPNPLLVEVADELAPGRALDAGRWDVVVAEERRRAVAASGVDAVVRAVRRA